jgi:hypothetical protein
LISVQVSLLYLGRFVYLSTVVTFLLNPSYPHSTSSFPVTLT